MLWNSSFWDYRNVKEASKIRYSQEVGRHFYFFKAKQFYSQKSAAEGLPDNIIYGPNHDLKLRICQSTNFISSGRNFVHTFLKIFQRKKKAATAEAFFRNR